MSNGFRLSTVTDYCLNNPWDGASESVTTTPDARRFVEAVSASNKVCDIIREWSGERMQRSQPLLVYHLWAPAAIQLLLKGFSNSNWQLREKAALNLQVVMNGMKLLAEFSELAEAMHCEFLHCRSFIN